MAMTQPVVPAVDPNQLAAQQQAFINQQAMLMVSGRDWLGGAQELGKSNALVYVLWRGLKRLTMLPSCLKPAL